VREKVIHPVEGSEKGRLTTAGGTDEGSDLAFANNDIDFFKGMGGTIKEIKSLCFDLDSEAWIYHQDRFWKLGDLGPFSEIIRL
jgi:hypothetical protein